MSYVGKQESMSVSVSVPVAGGNGSASLSQSNTDTRANYASVSEQSGIRAGSGGYNINVKGNTDLKGAVIDSSAQANQNNLSTGSITVSDVQNQMSVSSQTSGTTIGTGMLSGKYGAIKGAAQSVMDRGAANTSDASTTSSAIAAGAVRITNQAQQEQRTGRTAQEAVEGINRNTSNTSRALSRPDVAGIQQSAQDQREAANLMFSTLSVIGEKIYRKETEAKKIVRLQCEGAGKTNCTSSESVSLDQVKAVNGVITAFNNGMLNDEKQAVMAAYMQASGAQLKDGVLVIVNPNANDPLSEFAWVAWKKVEQVFGFGTSSVGDLNLALEAIAATQEAAKYNVISHSAGNFATDEMLRRMAEGNVSDAQIGKVTMFGSPVNAQDTADKVSQVTSGTGTVQQATHVNDFVSTVFGGNPSTGGQSNISGLDAHSSYTGDLTSSNSDKPQLPAFEVKEKPTENSPADIRERTDDRWGKGQFSSPSIVQPSSK
jgi:filamentous hemagglutinin